MLDPAIFFFKDPATQRGRPLMYRHSNSSVPAKRFFETPMINSRSAAAVSISVNKVSSASALMEKLSGCGTPRNLFVPIVLTRRYETL